MHASKRYWLGPVTIGSILVFLCFVAGCVLVLRQRNGHGDEAGDEADHVGYVDQLLAGVGNFLGRFVHARPQGNHQPNTDIEMGPMDQATADLDDSTSGGGASPAFRAPHNRY